ncbi:hypothetical protein BsWGS_05753 [Bradybaena similaris]
MGNAIANEAVIEVTTTQKNIPPPYDFLECKRQLMCDFINLCATDIGKVLEFHNGHYTESYKTLRLVMEQIENQLQNGGDIQASDLSAVSLILKGDNKRSVTIKFRRIPWERHCCNVCVHSEALKLEVIKVKEEIKMLDERSNRQFALSLVEEDYSKMGQLIECACCFGQCVFDNMAQCSDGHLVCVECLHSYINELLYGTGKVSVTCMTPECAAQYPQNELARCLDSKVLSKLEERILLENLNKAKIEDLVRCPYCDYAAILPQEETKYTCHRETCGKVTCRKCGKDWDDHEGLSCSDVETKDVAALRKAYEEKMTKAKVRTCANCNTDFTKETGCNKITCRCGMTMCYICRKPGVMYAHFCTHKERNEKCTHECCPLWTDTEEDDERAVQEIKKEAKMKRKALGYEGDRDIGAPDDKKAKFYFF